MIRRGNSSNKSRILVSFLALLLAIFANFAWAQATQGDQEDATADDTAELGKVTVTGSRIKRSELEGPQPILIIDQEQMSERGYTTVYEALSDLTINNGYKFEGAEAALFTPDVETILGRPAHSFRSFAEESRAAWD